MQWTEMVHGIHMTESQIVLSYTKGVFSPHEHDLLTSIYCYIRLTLQTSQPKAQRNIHQENRYIACRRRPIKSAPAK